MKRHATVARLMAAATLLLSPATAAIDADVATECEDVGRAIPIPGALCGILSDTAGEPLDETDVQLLNPTAVVATTRSDKNGRFTFKRVPAGKYSINSPGFQATGYAILITDARATTCRRRVHVTLGVGSCMSGVWSGGGLRLRVKSTTPADVSVDGGYQPRGEFNGDFELIALGPGTHHVEIEAVDYEPLSFDVTTREFDPVTRAVTLKRVSR
jgi:Carboxypeptidase regulatory-like domain